MHDSGYLDLSRVQEHVARVIIIKGAWFQIGTLALLDSHSSAIVPISTGA